MKGDGWVLVIWGCVLFFLAAALIMRESWLPAVQQWVDERLGDQQVEEELLLAVVTIEPTLRPTASFSTTTPRPATAIPTVAPPLFITHTVQFGDTLTDLATFYTVELDDIYRASQLASRDQILVGQPITIPLPGFFDPTPTVLSTVAVPVPTAMPPVSTPSVTPIPATSTPIPGSPTPLPPNINGVLIEQILFIPPDVLDNVRQIYAAGQQAGRNPAAFSKVGDSTIDNEHFISFFDDRERYDLGEYSWLQPTIDYYSGSFERQSQAVRIGLHSWTVFDPLWADKSVCEPGESVIDCELRLHNPSILLIRMGANDVDVPEAFDENLRRLVELAISEGIVPILGTKSDRIEGSNRNNEIVYAIAADYKIPVWDFDRLADTLPGRGLDLDGVHMTAYWTNDYSDPEAFQRGHAVHSLSALVSLHIMFEEVVELQQ